MRKADHRARWSLDRRLGYHWSRSERDDVSTNPNAMSVTIRISAENSHPSSDGVQKTWTVVKRKEDYLHNLALMYREIPPFNINYRQFLNFLTTHRQLQILSVEWEMKWPFDKNMGGAVIPFLRYYFGLCLGRMKKGYSPPRTVGLQTEIWTGDHHKTKEY